MELTPREKDKLLLYTAGLVAERRLARLTPDGETGHIGPDLPTFSAKFRKIITQILCIILKILKKS